MASNRISNASDPYGNPYDYWRAKNPNYWRRAEWHDYSSRSIYMITIVKSFGMPNFSRIIAPDGNPDNAYTDLSTIGCLINTEIHNLGLKSKAVDIPTYVIMPDHVHVVVFVKEAGVTKLSNIISTLKGACSSAWQRHSGNDHIEQVFLRGYHDRILRKRGQYAVMKKYVRDNPRRLYIKRHHKEYFSKINKIEIGGKCYSAYGNYLLLNSPFKEAVKISRKYSEETKAKLQAAWLDNASRGGVLVSPFIHPEEKTALKAGADAGGLIIRIVEKGFPERYKPSGIYFDLCAQGRLLEIAIDDYYTGKTQNLREKALRMNALAASIASEI